MKRVIIFFCLAMLLSCKEEANIFDDLTQKGGFIVFKTELNPLHDILGEDTVIDIEVEDPNKNAIEYAVVIEKEDGTLSDKVGSVTNFPGRLLVKRERVLEALQLSMATELPQNIKFIGVVTTNKGVFSGQDASFDTTTNQSTGGDTFYDGLANIPRQAMKFSMVMFQLVSPNEEARFSIATDNDDVEEILSANGEGGIVGEMDLTSSDLELGELSGGQGLMSIGLRFNFIGLPKGANITTAKIQFQTDNTGANPVEMLIYAEDAGNSEAFTNDLNNLSSRKLTSSSVLWNIPEWENVGDRGSAQMSVDFSQVLQQVVNRADWVPGNSISIILKPTGSSLDVMTTSGGREAEAGPGDDSAQLIISYSE